MNYGQITVITPPDRFFNLDSCYLLVNPSPTLSQEFYHLLCVNDANVNLFVYDTTCDNLEWLLSAACQSDLIIIDVDHCTPKTSQLLGFLLTHPTAYYLTKDDDTPYALISRNRLYDINHIKPKPNYEDEDE